MDPMILILIIGGGAALVLLVIGLVVTATSERSLVEERFGRYIDEDVEQARDIGQDKSSPVADWLNRRIEKSSLGGGASTSRP